MILNLTSQKNGDILNLTSQKNGDELTVFLSGKVDTLNAPELSDLLNRELDGVKTLTLDFAECDFVSSAGLRVLLNTFKQMKAKNGTMNLVNVGEYLMEVLHDTGLDAVFGM